MCINSASDWAEKYCSRSFKSASRTTFFDGNLSNEVLLPHYPITGVTDLRIDSAHVFGADTVIPSTDYAIVAEVSLKLHSTLFPNGSQNCKLSYTAGYTSVPADIAMATLILVDWFFRYRGDRRTGKSSVSKMGETVDFRESIPKEVLDLLANHMNVAYHIGMLKPGRTI
jgi:hypothetical protein